jgi:capsular polysaccharide biosynthesis protein
MALFGNKSVYRPLHSFANTESFKKISRRALFEPSSEPLTYTLDQGHVINCPRTFFEHSLPVYGRNLTDNVTNRAPYESLPLHAVKFPNSFINPTWGLVVTSTYELFEPSARAAKWKSPDLTQVPGIGVTDGEPFLNLRLLPKKALRGTYLVLSHWGGRNYGHFLLDCLPGVLFFYKEILQDKLKLITPPLQSWQREYLDILGIDETKTFSSVGDTFLKCENIIWPSPLQFNLHHPSLFTRTLGSYLTTSVDKEKFELDSNLIFISRSRTWSGPFARKMENESELIKLLFERGFVVVRPEEYSVADQIALFSNAKIIVGESGAAMANIVFAPPGCQVVEIMPEHRNRPWVKKLCGLLDLDWYCIFASVPPTKRKTTVIQGVQFDNLDFSYEVNTAYVIEAVDRAIGKAK